MKDLISRQAAIDALGEEPPVWYDGENEIAERDQWRRDVNAIKAVPSSQPDIIKCKDCKHYKEWESEFTPNAVVTQCMADNFPIRKAIPDGWFCAGAERRTE